VLHIGSPVLDESDALPELVLTEFVSNLVGDDSGAYPDPSNQDRGTLSAGSPASRRTMTLALSPEEVVEHNDRDEADRERGEPQQSDEEQFQGKHNGASLARG
jgi:hypothetical protein